MRAHPCAQFGERIALGQDRARDKLRLPALAMSRYHKTTGNFIGDLGAKILAHDVDAEIETGGPPGRTHDVTIVDIKHLNYSANALIVLGMALWLIYTFGAARFVRWSALKYTTMTMLFGLITIIAINAILALTHTIVLPGPADLLFILPHVLYMGLIASVVGVLCWNLGNRILTPLNGVPFMDVVPITAFTVSAITGVLPTRVQIIGACITGGALILNNLYLRRRT